MKDRVKTLLLYANGPSRLKFVTAETVLRGVLRLPQEARVPARIPGNAWLNRVVGYHYETLSYMRDWQDAFASDPLLDTETCNILDLTEYAAARKKIKQYPLIVVLHSAAGDDLSLLRRTQSWFNDRRGKLLVFVGNEYDLMPDKIGFLQAVDADYVASQLPLDAAAWLYAPARRTRLLAAPHALNPRVYFPDRSVTREVDIGFVGDIYPYFIGDNERTRMIQFFQANGHALGLTSDIRAQRMPRNDWAGFLRSCNGIVGAESGTYYLERGDETKSAVQAYLQSHPQATFDEVFARFFQNYPHPVSGKAISSRHFEPLGTRTCQILLEGRYNDILVANEHYISLKKDLSNIDDVVAQFKDVPYREAMTQRAHEFALAAHTYQHRVRDLLGSVLAA